MSMNIDFDVFKHKAAHGTYEKREEPSSDALVKSIEQIADEFGKFKANHESRLDKMELRLARPGAFVAPSAGPEETHSFAITVEGKRIPLLSKSQRLQDMNARTPEDFDLALFARGAVMGSTKAASGPALVTDRLASTVIDDVRRQTVIVDAGASTLPIEGPTVLARLTSDATVHQHTESANDITESDIQLVAVKCNPKTLVALVPLTEEVVADSPNLATALRMALSAAFAAKVDSLSLATILADVSIPDSATGQDPAIWLKCLEAVGAAMAVDQPIPSSMICNTADFIARSSQLASTAGTWLGKPPVLSSMGEYPTTGVAAGTAIYGGFARAFALCVRQELRLEVVRWQNPGKATHLLVAHMRADGVVLQPKSLFVQRKTV